MEWKKKLPLCFLRLPHFGIIMNGHTLSFSSSSEYKRKWVLNLGLVGTTMNGRLAKEKINVGFKVELRRGPIL